MFKNYLTYQFAQAFDRACRSAEVSPALKTSLVDSSSKMIDHFARSINATDPTEEAKLLVVALFCLRDSRAILDQAGIQVFEIDARYVVLHRRLENLCQEATRPNRGVQVFKLSS